MENGVAKPFPTIYHGPGGLHCHYHSRRHYEGTLAEVPDSVAGSSQLPSCSGKQPTKKQSRIAREQASIGLSKGMQLSHFFLVPNN